jgi:hypothetical protein
MRNDVLLLLLCVGLLPLTLGANTDKLQDQLIGTWSGAWTPEGGIRDSMTIELKRDENGKLNGRFVTPSSMNFNKMAFNSKARTLTVEALDEKSGKEFTLSAKVEGNEINGSLTVDKQRGKVNLIKWTYIPPVKW